MAKKQTSRATPEQIDAAVKEAANEIAGERKGERTEAELNDLLSRLGRPTKYNRKFCESLLRYFLRFKPYRLVPTMFGPKEIPCDLPTLAGFATGIGVHRDTLHEWASKIDKQGKLVHPEFSDAIKKAKTIQEDILVTNGLRKNYDKTFGIFFAKNNLDYKDKYEVEETAAKGYNELDDDLPPPKSAAEAKRLAERGPKNGVNA